MIKPAHASLRLLILLGLCAVGVSTGCAHKQQAARPPVVVKKPVEPWFSARSFCTLPLNEAELPATAGQLAQSINDRWRKSVKLPVGAPLITIVGGRYPAVDAMRVDLSGGVVVPGGRAAATMPEARPGAPAIYASDFALLAEPLVTKNGRINVQVSASNVRFELQKSKEGRPYLMMTDASEGVLHFDAAAVDLQKMALAMAKESAGKGLVTVRSVDLKFASRGDRALDLDMHVSTLVGFIPAGLRFTCRVDVDEAMNARISNLDVEGDDILGPLITQFIRPSLAKYDGKTKPLVGFPNQQLKLKDVRIVAGERVSLDAVFAR